MAVVDFLVGLVHCSRDPQTSFFNKTFIKNGSHSTIYTFKNYFATVFLVFSKISDIQTPSSRFWLSCTSCHLLLEFFFGNQKMSWGTCMAILFGRYHNSTVLTFGRI